MTVSRWEPNRDEIRAGLVKATEQFHEIRRSLSEQDWREPSLNPGWTNGEIMFHVTFAFILVSRLAPMVRFWSRLPAGFSLVFAGILNLLTPAFNAVNALGARAGARVYSRKWIGRRYDRAYASILSLLSKVPDDEWSAGMYYPTRWDGLFSEDWSTLVAKAAEQARTYAGLPPEAIRAIRAPALVMVADGDVVRIEHAQELSRLLRAELVVLPDSDHYSYLADPGGLLSRLI